MFTEAPKGRAFRVSTKKIEWMKFCPNCGAKLQTSSAKFCHECGAKLQSATPNVTPDQSADLDRKVKTSDTEEEEILEPAKLNVYDLGVKLEETVASIFERMGYSAQRRQRVPTKTGATAEIDVILTRGNRTRAVECKNYDLSRAVGVSELRVFKNKLDDSGIASGIFVTSSIFSRDAQQFGDSTGINLWDHEELRQKFYALAIGRIVNPSLVNDPILPVHQDFQSASTLTLKNDASVNLFNAVLFYHPYIITKYRLFARRKDPTGKNHKILDEGACIVDALDGEIINKEKGLIGGISGFLKGQKERRESKERKLVTEDIMNISAVKMPVVKTSDYEVTVAEPSVSEEDALRMTKQYAIEKNTRTIRYQPKRSQEDLFGVLDTRSIKVVPRLKEITIRGQKLVLVPKWDLQYESGQRSFQRRFLASSSSIIEDNLEKCGICRLLGKTTIAVCEVCGLPLCQKHSYQEESKWLCEEHLSEITRKEIKSKGFVSKLFGRK